MVGGVLSDGEAGGDSDDSDGDDGGVAVLCPCGLGDLGCECALEECFAGCFCCLECGLLHTS